MDAAFDKLLQLLLELLLMFVPTPLMLLVIDEGDSLRSGVARTLEPRFFDARPFVFGPLFATGTPLGLLLLLQIPPPLLPSIECDLQLDEVQGIRKKEKDFIRKLLANYKYDKIELLFFKVHRSTCKTTFR